FRSTETGVGAVDVGAGVDVEVPARRGQPGAVAGTAGRGAGGAAVVVDRVRPAATDRLHLVDGPRSGHEAAVIADPGVGESADADRLDRPGVRVVAVVVARVRHTDVNEHPRGRLGDAADVGVGAACSPLLAAPQRHAHGGEPGPLLADAGHQMWPTTSSPSAGAAVRWMSPPSAS